MSGEMDGLRRLAEHKRYGAAVTVAGSLTRMPSVHRFDDGRSSAQRAFIVFGDIGETRVLVFRTARVTYSVVQKSGTGMFVRKEKKNNKTKMRNNNTF